MFRRPVVNTIGTRQVGAWAIFDDCGFVKWKKGSPTFQLVDCYIIFLPGESQLLA